MKNLNYYITKFGLAIIKDKDDAHCIRSNSDRFLKMLFYEIENGHQIQTLKRKVKDGIRYENFNPPAYYLFMLVHTAETRQVGG